jgi:plasmid stabilization system protein ParE
MTFGMIKMSYSVKPSRFAKEDRKNITVHLEQYSKTAPSRFNNELKRYIGILGETPYIFAEYSSNPEYRHVVVFGSYVMFYTVDEPLKTVYVYRILHGAQDIENIL